MHTYSIFLFSCVSSNCYGLSTTNCWDWSGPGGGGAGGSIFLRGLVVDIGIIPVTATPGRGGYGSTGCGGDGGMGRIRIDSHILNGNTNPPPVKVVINNTFNVTLHVTQCRGTLTHCVWTCCCRIWLFWPGTLFRRPLLLQFLSHPCTLDVLKTQVFVSSSTKLRMITR